MTVAARHVTDKPVASGDFKYYTLYGSTKIIGMNFICLCGCGEKGSLSFRQWRTRPWWDWDGNKEKPTLHPSVHNIDGCGWHGWLRAGQWEPC